MITTKLQINALIVTIILASIQGFILYEINGRLIDVLIGSNCGPNPLVIMTIFGPAIALAYVVKIFAVRKGE